MNRVILILTLILSTSLNAAELIPFSRYVDERPNWFKDGTEIAYAENRCGGLYSAIGVFFDANGTTQEDKETSLRMSKQGEALMMRGGVLATKYGMTAKNSAKRTEALFKAYVAKLSENKRLNNNIFSEEITADLNFCEELLKITKVIDKAMAGQN